ncbi:HU family DNA-binding protein [uncultured Parabacteroides sp.]|uniref:HU family DNA-binding protein n=1 Tax=uncultured Parabacteroides sp. TaxID=512312 RepID=UPI0025DF3939|nr:HU family DNA-binding protein [uncultured Parabacteroides sp.]
MAQGYVLVLRPSEPGNKDSEKKYYAMSKSTGTVDLKYLGKLISARSSISSADVKSVLDNLNFFMDLELQEGKIIQLGELGNFRISVGSEGVSDKKLFHPSMIRPPRLIFTPGSELKGTKRLLTFSPVTAETPATPDDPGKEEERPGEL